jgi:integrase
LEEYDRAFRSQINPRIGGMRVRDVSHGDVDRLHHAMRSTPPTANRTVAALSKFFSWAIRGGYRPDHQNPCRGLEKFKEHPRKRYLASSEIAAVGDAIRACEADGRLNIWQAGLIRALLLTGLRRDELRTLEWRCVDLDRAVLILEDPKTEPRDVPISAPLQLLLSGLMRIEGNPYVFPGNKPGRPLVNLAKPWRRVLIEAGIDPTRIHDLRHTAASIAVGAGASLPLIGGVLGHKSPQTTARYAHLSDDPVRAVSEEIAGRVDRTMEGKTADVTPFKLRTRK